MKRTAVVTTITAIVLLFYLSAAAQKKPVSSTSPSVSVLEGLTVANSFSLPAIKFRIRLPQTPTFKPDITNRSDGFRLYKYQWDLKVCRFTFIYSRSARENFNEPLVLIKGRLSGIVRAQMDQEVVGVKDIQTKDHIGVEVRGQRPGVSKSLTRMFLAGEANNANFAVVAYYDDGDPELEALVKKTVDSMSIDGNMIIRPELGAEFGGEDSPVLDRAGTDWKDDNLRGKVRSITVFQRSADGKDIDYYENIYYSPDGYRTKAVFRPLGDTPNERTYYFNGPGQGSATFYRPKPKGPDDRPEEVLGPYLKYDFVYDKGRRLMERVATGIKTKKLDHRLKFAYTAGKIEKKYFDGAGALVYTTLITLDGEGNPVEEATTYADLKKEPETIVYTYLPEFGGSQGNWTARDVFRRNAGKLEKLRREERSFVFWD